MRTASSLLIMTGIAFLTITSAVQAASPTEKVLLNFLVTQSGDPNGIDPEAGLTIDKSAAL